MSAMYESRYVNPAASNREKQSACEMADYHLASYREIYEI